MLDRALHLQPFEVLLGARAGSLLHRARQEEAARGRLVLLLVFALLRQAPFFTLGRDAVGYRFGLAEAALVDEQAHAVLPHLAEVPRLLVPPDDAGLLQLTRDGVGRLAGVLAQVDGAQAFRLRAHPTIVRRLRRDRRSPPGTRAAPTGSNRPSASARTQAPRSGSRRCRT